MLRPFDAVLLPSSLLGWGALAWIPLAPVHCRLCDGFDDSGVPGSAGAGQGSLNGIDAAFHDALTGAVVSRSTAGTLSSAIVYGAAPALAVGAAFFAAGPHASPRAGLRTLVIVVESVAVSGLATNALKVIFARKRPFVRYGHGTVGVGAGYDVDDADSHLGFVSGHTSAMAAIGVSTALCASLQDSEAAPALWAAAGTLVVLTGTLRMVAEKHYFTDVLGGAAVGAGAGVLVPLLHRKGLQVGPGGLAWSF